MAEKLTTSEGQKRLDQLMRHFGYTQIFPDDPAPKYLNFEKPVGDTEYPKFHLRVYLSETGLRNELDFHVDERQKRSKNSPRSELRRYEEIRKLVKGIELLELDEFSDFLRSLKGAMLFGKPRQLEKATGKKGNQKKAVKRLSRDRSTSRSRLVKKKMKQQKYQDEDFSL